MQTLSIVIPVYNSEETLEPLCTALVCLYGQQYRLQIVLVNDGSRDRSDARCRQLHAAYPGVITYAKLARNFGEHNAVMAGLHLAQGDYCVVMDDDLQNPPEEVGKLLEEIEKGYDAVYARYTKRRDTVFRRMGSRFHDRVAALVLKKPLNLTLSSFKIMNRFLYREIIKYRGPAPYIDAIILRTTDNIASVTLEHRRRAAHRSGYSLSRLFSLWGSMVVSYSLVPLRIIGMLGLSLMAVAVLYGGYKAFDEFHTLGRLTEFETLMSFNLFFRGLAMTAISVLGEYVGRIHLLLNRDPQFVVRERIGSAGAERPVILAEYKAGNDLR